MKAYRLPSADGIDSLTLTETDAPRPGPGQVLVEMRAASLNFRDLVVAKGGYGRNVKLPLTPLSDGAGVVAEAGPGVEGFQTGDRVAGIFMQGWLSGGFRDEYGATALGGAVDGVLAEYVVFEESGLVRVPDHLSFEEAATLPCAAVTAWHALFPAGGVESGQTILTMGSGGVAVFALQFARLAGATVIAMSSDNEKAERLQELGASQLVNYRETPKWGKVVRELAGGAGVDCVVEVGGAGTLEQSLRAVRGGGAVSLIGVLAGPGEFNPNWIFMKAVKLQGIYVGSREMFVNMAQMIGDSGMRPAIDRVFPLGELKAAMRYLESGAHFGKVVVGIRD